MSILKNTMSTLAVSFFWAMPADAQTPLLEVYAACEASVMNKSDEPLGSIGALIDKDNSGSRRQIDTPVGAMMAMFISSRQGITACVLWGRHPELEVEFRDRWTDWVEWDEAISASESWFNSAMQAPDSVDLTEHAKPGHVVARCKSLEHGVVLSSQPAIGNVVRQVLPESKPKHQPVQFYQFSVITALPGRCAAAVNAHAR
ncbi:MAG: hypothetical protein ACRBB0_18430 [Pelagimonas sp.]|uniref:hypothetical protein n=1 Tax=Pelagimonas sp. TaxID=2073170 RepID=UPI003D6C339A